MQLPGYETPFPSKVIAVSHHEEYLVNGGDSSFVQVYALKGNAKPRVIKGLGGATNDVEFLPDDSGFLVTIQDKTLSCGYAGEDDPKTDYFYRMSSRR